MLQVDDFQDFYPAYTGRFQNYQSASPTDAAPQAATIPPNLAMSMGKGGLQALHPQSPIFWGLLFVGAYLVLMHVVE